MSAVGNATPGLWGSFGGALRLIVGWFSVAISILNLLVDMYPTSSAPDGAYLLFHAMLLVGGLLLILGIGADPGAAGYTTFGVVLVAGLLAGALPANDAVCCMTTYAVRHGYPFSFLARNEGGSWHLDSWHLLADLLFWGYAGLVVLVLVTVARRATKHHAGGRE